MTLPALEEIRNENNTIGPNWNIKLICYSNIVLIISLFCPSLQKYSMLHQLTNQGQMYLTAYRPFPRDF